MRAKGDNNYKKTPKKILGYSSILGLHDHRNSEKIDFLATKFQRQTQSAVPKSPRLELEDEAGELSTPTKLEINRFRRSFRYEQTKIIELVPARVVITCSKLKNRTIWLMRNMFQVPWWIVDSTGRSIVNSMGSSRRRISLLPVSFVKTEQPE